MVRGLSLQDYVSLNSEVRGLFHGWLPGAAAEVAQFGGNFGEVVVP